MVTILLVPAFLAFHFLLLLCPRMFVHGATTSLCSQTPYPELCNNFMVTTTQQTYRDSALSVTLAQAERAHRLVSSTDLSSFDNRAKSAWADCLELYEDSVNLVNRSISARNAYDAQTWLSAALTNHETCKTGFLDFNLSLNNYLKSSPFILSDMSKFLSNSLAINKLKATSAKTSVSSEKPKGRRLLSHDMPEWLSVADRKLLQAAGLKADAVVAKDGSGNYMTISAAVEAAGSKRSGRFVIYVKRGVYKENVVIKKTVKNIMLIGDGIDATIVTASRSAEDGSTTFRSATLGISGDGFMAKGITFENTAGPQKHQAVAVRSSSDYSVFYSCSFKGYQDTLYVYSLRQFFRDCDIYGTVDFIFGNAIAVLQNCNIYIRKPMGGQFTTVTAQHRIDPGQNTGLILHNSRVTASSDMRPVQGSYKSYLGRPWGQYSRTVFMKCAIDGLINSAGWLPWSGDFALKTLYYAEYMNTGAGAGTGGRVKWPGYHVITSPAEAGKFSVGSFLNGNSWLPGTGVPFAAGL